MTATLFTTEVEPVAESAVSVNPTEPVIVLDRSTLEPYLDCPLSGRLRQESVKSVGLIAATGNEVHRAISAALVSYVESHLADGSNLKTRDLRNILESESWASRADIQPDAVKAIKYSLYSTAEAIANVNPQSILAFDGGEDLYMPDKQHVADGMLQLTADEFTAVADDVSNLTVGLAVLGYGIPAGTKISKIGDDGILLSNPAQLTRTVRVEYSKRISRCLSGQLDLDIPWGKQPLRFTAEMDFLHSTKTPGLLRLWDWKSGFATWTESAVEDSFQFQTYAMLVLENYPDIDAVDVVVLNTRKNQATMPVRFHREDVSRIRTRLRTAIGQYWLNRGKPLEQVAAYPSREGCRLCEAAALCHACDEDIRDVKANPEKWVDALYTLSRKSEEIEKTLKSVMGDRMASGNFQDIETPQGNRWGYKKPKRETKPRATLYGGGKADSSDESGE